MNSGWVIILLLSLLAGRHRYKVGHHTQNRERLGTAILSAALVAWLLTVVFLLGRIAALVLAPVADVVHNACWIGKTAKGGPNPRASDPRTLSRSGAFTDHASFDLPLPMKTAAARGDEALVSLRFPDASTPQPEPLYIRTMTFDRFDGRTWRHTLPMLDASGNADDAGWVRVGSREWDLEVEVGVPSRTEEGFPALCESQVLCADNLLISGGCFFLPDMPRNGLRMRQRVRRVSPDRPSWEGVLPGPAEPEYRAIPGGVQGEALQKWMGDAGTLPAHQRVTALLDRLQTSFRYAEEVQIPEGHLPLVELLENQQEGNCLLLASVFTLAARQCGFPARLCVGYVGGQRDASGCIVTFAGRDAHAWCEIKLLGEGWRMVDPTRIIAPKVLARDASQAIAPLDFSSLRSAARSVRIMAGMQITDLESEPYWLIILLALGIPFALLLVFRKKKQGGVRWTPSAGKRRRTRILDLIDSISRAWNVPWPKSRPLREQVRRLQEADFPTDQLQDAVNYVYDAIYGNRTADPRKEQQLCRQLQHLLDETRMPPKGSA